MVSDVSQQDKQTDRRSGIGIHLMLAGRKSTKYARDDISRPSHITGGKGMQLLSDWSTLCQFLEFAD